jgi:uncharacterized protein (TIGR04255 family)
MAAPKKRIPTELRHDAIVEALFEARFDMTTIPEVLLGRLADCPSWKGFEQVRMPTYEIPAFLRQADPNLRYQPIFELHNANKNRLVRIGGQVMSYHRLPPYESWTKFKPELDAAIDALFAKADGLSVRRLGLRYINAIRPELHQISTIAELDLTVAVEHEAVTGNVNINFTTDLSDDTQCTVRVATAEFVQGTLPPNSRVLIDVDVFTKEDFTTNDVQKVRQWVESAHTMEKQQFFRLLTDATIDALEEK